MTGQPRQSVGRVGRATKQSSILPLAFLVLAAACAITYAGPNAPPLRIIKGPYLQNVTLNSIVVMWETNLPSDARVDFGSTVDYANHIPDDALSTVHRLTLSGLQDDTTFHYRVTSTDAGQSASSDDSTFQTAVAPGTPFRFAVYGDTRSDPKDHARVANGIAASHPRFVIHTGDFVADGREYDRWQNEYFEPAAELLRTTVLFPCLGNHEQNAEWYYRFFSPPPGGGHEGKQWYSFDYGDAHFAVIDTDADFSPGSEQYRWLRADLQAAQAEWLFVVHHHPAYSSGGHGGTKKVQQYLAPLYQVTGVDMVFSGHDHLYERSYEDGVYYVVSGGGGAPLSPSGLKHNPYQQVTKARYHFCTVGIDGKTATLQAHYPDGTIFDSVTMRHVGPGRRKQPVLVPGPRIELGTPGSSVRCSTS